MTLVKILGIIVLLSLPVCMFLVVRKHLALTRAAQYEGRVVGYERVPTSSTTTGLKVRYKDADDAEHEFVTTTASRPPTRNIGDHVIVFHHSDGSTPDILVFEDLYLGYWIWMCFGILIAGCMLFPYLLDAIYLRA